MKDEDMDIKKAIEGSRELPTNSDPRSQGEEGENVFYIDENFFGEREMEEGDKVTLTGQIVSVGSKLGVTIDDIEKSKDYKKED